MLRRNLPRLFTSYWKLLCDSSKYLLKRNHYWQHEMSKIKVFLVRGFCPLKTEISDFLSDFIWRSQEEWEEQCQLHVVTVRLWFYLCIYFFRFFFCFLVSFVHLVFLYQLLKYIKLLATCVRIYTKLFFKNMAFHETTYTKHQVHVPTKE